MYIYVYTKLRKYGKSCCIDCSTLPVHPDSEALTHAEPLEHRLRTIVSPSCCKSALDTLMTIEEVVCLNLCACNLDLYWANQSRIP